MSDTALQCVGWPSPRGNGLVRLVDGTSPTNVHVPDRMQIYADMAATDWNFPGASDW